MQTAVTATSLTRQVHTSAICCTPATIICTAATVLMTDGALGRCHDSRISMSQANEAKSAAVEEVERLLQHSEDLKRLHTLCQDYDHKAQVRIPAAALCCAAEHCIISHHQACACGSDQQRKLFWCIGRRRRRS